MSDRKGGYGGLERSLRVLASAIVVVVSCLLGRSAGAATPLAISPASAMVAPNGTQSFTASGGSGMGYAWTLPVAPSGGNIDNSGNYTAGNTPNVTDQVQVTDSALNTATAIVTVGGGVTITPSSAILSPGEMQMFTASGGKSPYTWVILVAASGMTASVTGNGLYTAGASIGMDTVQVTDSIGNKGTVVIDVVAMVPIGSECTSSGTCPVTADGQRYCSDGVCCSTACSGQCQACNSASKLGTCVTISGPPVGKRPACPMSDPNNVCSSKVCDGTSATACTSFAGKETMCGVASCVDLVGTPNAFCEGDGGCQPVVAAPCQPYACVSSACASTCTNTSECSPGNYCDVTTGTCVVPTGSAGSGAGSGAGTGASPTVSAGCAVGARDGVPFFGLTAFVTAFGLLRRRERRRRAS